MILGHSNISVTLGIYTHVDEGSRRDALDWLDQSLRLPPRITGKRRDASHALLPAETIKNIYSHRSRRTGRPSLDAMNQAVSVSTLTRGQNDEADRPARR